MAWNYFYTTNSCFDERLIQLIKQENNVEVQSIINNAKYLCTSVDSSGASLLHYAAEYGNEDITKYLIILGSNVNLQDQLGRTPLILATRAQHKVVIKVLLESRADIYLWDENGWSALQIAININPSHASITRLFIAQVIRNCSLIAAESTKIFVAANCPLFKVAVLKGTAAILSLMVKEGTPIDAKDPMFGKTALHVAVKNLDVGAVEALISAGADVNAQDNSKQTPIAMFTDFTNHPTSKWKIVKTLINKGAVLTTCTDVGVMQMYWILRYGDREAVRMIVESNVDFSARDIHRQTALHYLASNTYPGIVEELKSSDIEVDARDENGTTALHIAMAIGNSEVVEYLVGKGADVNVKTDTGITPIFQVFNSGKLLEHVKCVKLLVEHGACAETELQSYFSMYDTDLAVNQDYLLLKPLLAQLVLCEGQGKMKISGDIFQRISSYPCLKNYVDSYGAELQLKKRGTISEVATSFDFSSEKTKKVVVYEDSVLDMEKITTESKCKKSYFDFFSLALLKIISKRCCQKLELKILDIFGTSIALIFVAAYAILCVAPPQKQST